MGWERWQQLPPERKEHYKRQAHGYADRGRKALDERRAEALAAKKRRRRTPSASRAAPAARPRRRRLRLQR